MNVWTGVLGAAVLLAAAAGNACGADGTGSQQQTEAARGTLRVPACTAYIEPEPDALKVSDRSGITGWADAGKKVVWYGKLAHTGKLEIALALRLPDKAVSNLRLKVAAVGGTLSPVGPTGVSGLPAGGTGVSGLPAEGTGVSGLPAGGTGVSGLPAGGTGVSLLPALTAQAKGIADTQSQTVAFGSVDITAPGYYSFTLEGVSKEGRTFGDLDALLLSGPAAKDAHFNLKPRRNAASVHLGYPAPKGAKVEWFYNEVTVKTDPLWSYYMACGYHRGYFGIQVNSPTERRIIFSVWDSGNEGVDRKKVAAEDKVQLVAKGEGVFAGGFGNEGTGGHSHLVYSWKTGETYRFLLSAKPDGKDTVYSGYFYFPERKAWGLIASFRAPKDGSYLKGLYSFNENFGGANGDKRRLAEFGNQWIKTADGQWTELLTAHFTHDATGGKDRLDYGAGVVGGRFYLSNGGFVGEAIKNGDKIVRPATEKPPADIELPAVAP